MLDIVLKDHPALRQSLLDSALSQYPVIGPQLGHDIGPLNQTGLALVVGLVGWLYLQAELTLFAVEINVVRALRLWPPPPGPAALHRAGRASLPALRGGDQARRGAGHRGGRQRLRR